MSGSHPRRDPPEPLLRAPARLARPHPARAERERHVLADAEPGEEEPVLERDAHVAAFGRELLDRHAVQLDPALVDRHQPRQRLDQGRLAGAVGPEDRHRLPVGRVQRRAQREPLATHDDLRDQRHR